MRCRCRWKRSYYEMETLGYTFQIDDLIGRRTAMQNLIGTTAGRCAARW
ncbi:MAG: hypothetical protein ACLR5S_08745 [Ruminococcus sp.]